jgi:hypothetical protein
MGLTGFAGFTNCPEGLLAGATAIPKKGSG